MTRQEGESELVSRLETRAEKIAAEVDRTFHEDDNAAYARALGKWRGIQEAIAEVWQYELEKEGLR